MLILYNKQFILAQARLGIGWARTGLGSGRLGSSWPGLGSALPVSAWLHLARPGLAWLCPGWLGSGSARARPCPASTLILGIRFFLQALIRIANIYIYNIDISVSLSLYIYIYI